jgi:hypothetical protein
MRKPLTAPVSHQKRPQQRATNAIDLERKPKEVDLSPPAQNGLVAGSSPAGPRPLAKRGMLPAPKPRGEGRLLGPRTAARQATHDRQGEACPP